MIDAAARVYAPDALARAAADLVLAIIMDALGKRGTAHVVLSSDVAAIGCCKSLGGLLRDLGPDIARISWYSADEEWADSRGNHSGGEAIRHGLGGVPRDRAHVISWRTAEGSPQRSALISAGYLEEIFGPENGPDLALLILRTGGGIAGLEIGGEAEYANGSRQVVCPALPGPAVAIRYGASWRLTMTPRLLARAGHTVIVVPEPAAADTLSRVRRGDTALPATWVLTPRTVFLVSSSVVPVHLA